MKKPNHAAKVIRNRKLAKAVAAMVPDPAPDPAATRVGARRVASSSPPAGLADPGRGRPPDPPGG